MAYQWIVNFTTSSVTLPTPPAHSAVVSMLGTLFTSPANVWTAGPQSVDDDAEEQVKGPVETVYQWIICLQTTDQTAPAINRITNALQGLYGPTVANVWLAGPQSVDDGPALESR
jgi:hypothetical protein